MKEKKLNPIEEAKFIESEFREYLKDTFSFKDNEYKTEFERELDKQVLYKGPFLNISLPFVSSKSINDLIEEGTVSPLFKKLNNIDFNQKLYYHQEQALRKLTNGRNVVITTGTGSGKTESFLYPILNSILRDIEKGDNGPGIRAILLYPMNALVNDQMDRLRNILMNYTEIRFGFFTGETEEEEYKNTREELFKKFGTKIPQNEVISREEIRNNPPHLLFTNYSMLEYLLIRPNDFKIFNKEYLRHWKFIVLDEAHTYSGALGIEVSYLLKRLTGLIEKKPQFILTSATLGEKGKDEQTIIEFAKSLTSSNYSESDIIFSTRKNLDDSNIEYQINPDIYCELEENLENKNIIENIAHKYTLTNSNDIEGILYELLIKDKNIYDLYNLLASKNRQFKDIIKQLKDNGFDKDQDLVSLIHLINVAKKNNKYLYDIKYHTFIRTLSGAFVTIDPKKYLTLTPTNKINELNTFELGTCRYCNTSFLFGKEIDGYLRKNDDVDIYENYGDNKIKEVDYYMIPNSAETENIDKSNCEEYELCGKCGYLCSSEKINNNKCKCDEKYKITVYKVKSNSMKNNINECPNCLHHQKNGIVRSINIGKDEATAILAQLLYKAIDNNEPEKTTDYKTVLFKRNETLKMAKEPYVKQFITFSDSRQQASFFASFFEGNHERFLRKRIIWEIIKNNNYQTIKFDNLLSQLDALIRKYNLFTNKKISSNKQAWITALYELLNIDGNYSAEGLGLFHFTLDLDDLFEEISEEDISNEFGKYNINKTDLKNIINVLFNIFRTTPAIEYNISGLNNSEKQEYLSYRRFDNYIKLKKQPSSKRNETETKYNNIRSLLPVYSSRDNMYTKYIMKVAQCSHEEACNIIEIIFNEIGVEGNICESGNSISDEVYQISASKYKLDNYKNTQYYICSNCGQLTIYNVHNVCTNKDCNGILKECDPDKIFENNYYRKEYQTKKIERINIKEHTAQLSQATAKEYQKEFKDKKINILSCSTTFEMGIDIGSLETVFMRNVPPTPANYVQRAGRAGRSKDSSAFILTYCGYSSHDYTYFDDPNKMISGIIKPPKFNNTNEKIILRHLMATAFGYFFRKYPEYFKNIDSLVCHDGIKEFKKYIEQNPDDLNEFINTKILDSNTYNKYSDYKWIDEIKNNGDYLEGFYTNIIDTINKYNFEIEKAKEENDFKNADYYQTQVNEIKKDSVIKNLTKYNVIPKYGFPIDLVNLEIWDNGKINNDYDLSRDLSIAISEYAPESEIIVDKIKYTSRYISLPKTQEFARNYYYTCPFCERENISLFPEKLKKCQYCEAPNEEIINNFFIEPIYGFKTGKTNESTRKKPKKTYTGMTSYIGNGKKDENKLMIGANNYITIETSSDDELLILNKNPFYMCKTCGYTKIDKTAYGSEKIKMNHVDFKGFNCPDEDLWHISLGHKFKTDVAKISIKNLNDKDKALSTLYAILEGISQEFSIERKDIDGLVVKNKYNNYDLIVFDNVPGGAGHVKRIMDKSMFIEVFKCAKNKVNQNCCDENTSCYNCLRNYNNQAFHHRLKRKYALEIIKKVLENIC